MAKGREFYTEHPNNPPEWYWKAGLHDACIIGVEAYKLSFDYSKYAVNKSKYDRNILSLKIDAKGALFDSNVKEIRFYNYKILPESIDLPSINFTGKNKLWWLSDKLIERNGKYEFDVLLEEIGSSPEEFHFKLCCDRVEIDRR